MIVKDVRRKRKERDNRGHKKKERRTQREKKSNEKTRDKKKVGRKKYQAIYEETRKKENK